MRHALITFAVVLAAPLAAQIGYETGFETLTASPLGIIITGQDGFYLPATSPLSLDGNVYSYAGNALGLPVNPNGGANFYAGSSDATGSGFARAQRALTIPTNSRVLIEFDVCCIYTGAVTPANNIGSVSFQPSTTCPIPILLAQWTPPIVFPPTTWDANLALGPTVAGAQTPHPDPNFRNLAVNVWHRWGCAVDYGTLEYVYFKITNGVTNVTTIYEPAPGAMLLTNSPATGFPTDFRIFAGGSTNVFAVDNLSITYFGTYVPFGTGCLGSGGIPALAGAAGSRPAIGAVHGVQLSNLPFNTGLVSMGFSDTYALGGSLPLPFDLTGFGLNGCTLLTDPAANTFLIGAGGVATWNLTIPANNAFLGIVFFNQGFSLDPGFNPAGLTVSNAARGVVGR